MTGAALPEALRQGPAFRWPDALRWAAVFGTTGAALPDLALRRPGPALHRWARRMQRRLRLRVELVGAPRLDAPLWVANHLSWVDPVVFLALRPMGTLAKGEVAGYPLVGRWARKGGLRFVDRVSPRSRAAALAAFAGDLRAGRPMLLFPEGTTTRGRLAPFHGGGLLAAWRLGIPAQPLRLETAADHYPWTGDETLLPHLGVLLRQPVTELRLHAGPLLDPRDFPDPADWIATFRHHLSSDDPADRA
ncbi:MAG TPA: lysophospholipid acyltransferase family protein [Holophagaceae bacterium]|nr:lysophospholipid acyltransferase family protein [Holophagaceae bacterium]